MDWREEEKECYTLYKNTLKAIMEANALLHHVPLLFLGR